MSKRDIVLIGTRHTYQYGAGATWGKVPCTLAQEQAFRDFVRSTALRTGARAIAEELNREGLEEVGKSISVLESVAGELQLPHRFCELTRAERVQAGVRGENDIRFDVFMSEGDEGDDGDEGSVGDEAKVQELLREQFRKREAEWLRRLLALNHWPVLYVCGANHVASFSALLSEAGISVELVHSDWTA